MVLAAGQGEGQGGDGSAFTGWDAFFWSRGQKPENYISQAPLQLEIKTQEATQKQKGGKGNFWPLWLLS